MVNLSAKSMDNLNRNFYQSSNGGPFTPLDSHSLSQQVGPMHDTMM